MSLSFYMSLRRIGLSCKDSSRLCSNSNVLLLFERARTFIKVRGSREVLFLLITFFSFSTAARRPGATFLLIPPSARATGMAYAYTAVCDDASANYYNAAGLAFFESPKMTMNYCGYQLGFHDNMHHLYFACVYPLHKSTWGFDIIFFTPGETVGWVPGLVEEGMPWRLAVRVNYSRLLTENLSLGVGFKVIYQYQLLLYSPFLPDSPWLNNIGFDQGGTGSSEALDFNILYKLHPKFSVGAVLHNIGLNVMYLNDSLSDPLPRLFRLGIAYEPINTEYLSCTFSAELTKVLNNMFYNEDNSFSENLKYEIKEAWKGIGLELTCYKTISLRAGYFYDMEGERKGFTFGTGINIKNLELDIGIDERIFDWQTKNRRISLSYTF